MHRLNQLAVQTTAAIITDGHPLDPLSPAEIEHAAAIVKAHMSRDPSAVYRFNLITLIEPKKTELLAWEASPNSVARPPRQAEVVLVTKGKKGVTEGTLCLTGSKILTWSQIEGVQPILTVDDLQKVEEIVRLDPEVIKQCEIIGIPASDMDKVYCDPWTIGFDDRWGAERRLQQAFLYYRSHQDDSQYSHPLDFTPIYDATERKVIFIDIPPVRRPLSKHKNSNFNPQDVNATTGYRTVKPIEVLQPEGVNFKMTGRVMEWQGFRFHVGFNYREGIVLNEISFNDNGNQRNIFHRLSLVEMVVPYGNPEHPHQRKHAFDLGEYGAGLMTNPLSLGCDCKGVIHYLDAHFSDAEGKPLTVKNAVCIHEEDNGLLFKHSDFRDGFDTSIVTRATKLILSQIFTAANYEYCVYWIFHQDGTIQLEIKLTGILNTFPCNQGEDLHGWGTEVYPGTNAHNHQHLFSLRINPAIDSQLHSGNSVAMVDAERSPFPPGHPENLHGNGFRPKRTVFKTSKESQTDYDGYTSRTWDFCNPKSINLYSHKPASYKLVSRECPPLLPKEGGLVWNRAGFARHHMQVVPYVDGQLYPAGRFVCQTSGKPSRGLPEWVEAAGNTNIDDADVVAYHTFGLTHFPAPEDFPVMPAEPMTLLLRPRNFFLQNPALNVPPSHARTTTEAQVTAGAQVVSLTDKVSQLAFNKSCCSK